MRRRITTRTAAAVGAVLLAAAVLAVDDNGGTATAAAALSPTTVTLIAKGSTWTYLDTGATPPGNWATGTVTGWKSGRGQLGAGDGDETTVINRRSPAHLIDYFRTNVDIAVPGDITTVTLDLLADDAAFVFVNGVRLINDNVRNDGYPVAPRSSANGENNYRTFSLAPSAFRQGSNTIAVELHQDYTSDTDSSFDASLTAVTSTADTTTTAPTTTSTTTTTTAPTTTTTAATTTAPTTTTTATTTTAPTTTTTATTTTAPTTTTTATTTTAPTTSTTATTTITTTTAPPVANPGVVVALKSTWRYLDFGNAPTDWNSPTFNDTTWAAGPAELGYGDGDEATVVSYGSDPNKKPITTWYRHAFNIPTVNGITDLGLKIRRDDGAVAYLNGVEVARSNMPTGTITPATVAVTSNIDEQALHAFTVPASAVRTGTNVLAVEIHQRTADSSDITFDAELTVNTQASTTTTTAPTTIPPPSTTMPPGTPPVGFVAFGDAGTGGSTQMNVANRMTTWAQTHRVDALVEAGDNVYEDGSPSLFASRLSTPYASLRATRPLWVALGNHDVLSGDGPAQLAYLGLPGSYYEKVIERDGVNIQLLFLDSNPESDFATEAAWLDQRLSTGTFRYRVVVFHHPVWTCGTHTNDAVTGTYFRPVLNVHQVDLVVEAHDHNYQRFTDNGVAYLVTGGGGKGLYALRACTAGTAPMAAGAAKYHFVGVEADATKMTVTAVDSTGAVFDTFTVT